MRENRKSIEVDEASAEALQQQAAVKGLTVAELVADLVPLANDIDTVAELERRWNEAQVAGTVSHDEVARWLDTWGTSAFSPWPHR